MAAEAFFSYDFFGNYEKDYNKRWRFVYEMEKICLLVNFKRNKGKIYAKLVREDKLREVSGWGDRFIVPNKEIDQNLLLPFDPFKGKVFFTQKETNNCDKYCYLIYIRFGIAQVQNYSKVRILHM